MSSIRFGLSLVVIAMPLVAQSGIEVPTTRQPAGKNRELHVRDVRALVVQLDGIGALPPGTGLEEEPLLEGRTVDRLARAVRALVSPPLRDGDVQIVSGNYLVSVGTAEQQGWIDDFLRSQSEAPETQIFVALNLYDVNAQSFKALRLANEARSYDAEEGKALVHRLDESGVEKKLAPRLVSLPWHESQIFVGEQIAYVRDFQVGVDDTGKAFADEVWESVLDGARFSVWSMHLRDNKIGLLGEIEISNAVQPFPKKVLEEAPGGRKLEIEMPTFTRSVGAIGVAVPEGGYAVVPCPPIEGRIPVVVIQVLSRR